MLFFSRNIIEIKIFFPNVRVMLPWNPQHIGMEIWTLQTPVAALYSLPKLIAFVVMELLWNLNKLPTTSPPSPLSIAGEGEFG